MVSLEVGIDARGVVQGSAQAMTALNGLSRLAREVADSLGGTSLAATTFGTALSRAMPWITAFGAALSGVSTVMLLLSQNTKQVSDTTDSATKSWENLRDVMWTVQARAGVSGSLGIKFDPNAAMADEWSSMAIDMQRKAIRGELPSSDPYTMGKRLSMDPSDVLAGLGRGSEEPSYFTTISPNEQISLVAEQANYNRLQSMHRSYAETADRSFSGMGPHLPPSEPYTSPYGPYMAGTSENAISAARAANYTSGLAADQQKAEAAERNRAMEETLRTAIQISDTLADGATNFAFGLSSARDVAVSILYDIARGLSREAFGTLTKSIVNSFQQTPAQSG